MATFTVAHDLPHFPFANHSQPVTTTTYLTIHESGTAFVEKIVPMHRPYNLSTAAFATGLGTNQTNFNASVSHVGATVSGSAGPVSSYALSPSVAYSSGTSLLLFGKKACFMLVVLVLGMFYVANI